MGPAEGSQDSRGEVPPISSAMRRRYRSMLTALDPLVLDVLAAASPRLLEVQPSVVRVAGRVGDEVGSVGGTTSPTPDDADQAGGLAVGSAATTAGRATGSRSHGPGIG